LTLGKLFIPFLTLQKILFFMWLVKSLKEGRKQLRAPVGEDEGECVAKIGERRDQRAC
jgi:hypothetical protein